MSKVVKNGAKSKKSSQSQPKSQPQVAKEPSYIYQSPKKDKVQICSAFRPTTIAKSPYSKMVDDHECNFTLPNPYLLKTPMPGVVDEMVFLKTPEHKITKMEGISIQKLDFDQEIMMSNRIIETVRSSEQDEYQYEYQSYEEEEMEKNYQEQEQEQAFIKSQVAAKSELEQNLSAPQYMSEKVISARNNYNPSNGKTCCNCRKSKCIKLYCDCFRSNRTCTNCSCGECINQHIHCQERIRAIALVLESNPFAFLPKIKMERHTKGCNCKKSGCHKRYCECYGAGLGCSDLCKCTECKNIDGEAREAKEKNERHYHMKQQHMTEHQFATANQNNSKLRNLLITKLLEKPEDVLTQREIDAKAK